VEEVKPLIVIDTLVTLNQRSGRYTRPDSASSSSSSGEPGERREALEALLHVPVGPRCSESIEVLPGSSGTHSK